MSPEDEMLEAAIDVCLISIAHWVIDGDIQIPPLDPDVAMVLAVSRPVYQSAGLPSHDPQFIGYDIADDAGADLLAAAFASAQAREHLAHLLSTNVEHAYPMPKAIRELAALFIFKRDWPRRKSGRPPVRHRDALIIALIDRCQRYHGLVVSTEAARAGEQPERCAASVVKHVMSHFISVPSTAEFAKIYYDKRGLDDPEEDLSFLLPSTNALMGGRHISIGEWERLTEQIADPRQEVLRLFGL